MKLFSCLICDCEQGEAVGEVSEHELGPHQEERGQGAEGEGGQPGAGGGGGGVGRAGGAGGGGGDRGRGVGGHGGGGEGVRGASHGGGGGNGAAAAAPRVVVVAGPANSDLLLSLPAVFLNCPSPYERPSVCVAQCTQLETDTDSASTFAALPPAVVIALALL